MPKVEQHINTRMDAYRHPSKFTPKGLMFHSTATKGVGALEYADRWDRPNLGKSVTAFVDGEHIVQILPSNYRVGHCRGTANKTHIAFEICEPPASLWANPAECMKYYNNAVWLAAQLCTQYKIPPVLPYLLTHCEGHRLGLASNHADVMHWFPKFGKSADTFRADVAAAMKIITPPKPTVTIGVVVDVPAKDTLNIRNSGSMQGAVIGKIPPGAKLQVIKQANDDWYEVIYNGVHGYAGKRYIQIIK